ncbi:type VI secretion system baseplate subunit TssF [Lampropedia aestuarii]|uniref:type VI secretion system baseplate subunit TssF n=1 Tax=Lampropedia aestuarii TaxID=2562762 RepID=UPI002468F3D9|nr:type VI secretion system baseplate subunit TssF [Lampropedia aestuarii]MDH5857390.1 type VI secretion system baseplate subunit TssF [Lampropedia aestuarii]
MDARFLDYYNRELAYLKELGGEFSASFPKVAAHLGMHGNTVSDPYVERLLEGFAFLASRIHLKMDAEFPRFSQRLLEVVFPHYLAPTPSMAIVQIPFDLTEAAKSTVNGAVLPRGSVLTSRAIAGVKTRCNFVTGHELESWPLDIVEASAGMLAGDMPGLGRQLRGKEAKGEVRLRLRYQTPGAAGRPNPDKLTFFLAADDALATLMYEKLIGHTVGVVVSVPGQAGQTMVLPAQALQPEGFAADQALLPNDPRVFQGYRLLHEYFAFPQRFMFFSIAGLKAPLAKLDTDVFELTVLLDCDPEGLVGTVDKSSFALNCVPVINIFPRQGNRLLVTHDGVEHHVVADRTRPLDYEVYRVDMVDGYDRGNNPVTSFVPFYRHVGNQYPGAQAYFSTRRESRRMSETMMRHGGRSSYLGSEVFISLVDAQEAPWPHAIDQLSIQMLLTNRDLPLLMPVNGERDVEVETDQAMRWGRVLKGPSMPRFAMADREVTWRLISHLSLNYLALRDQDPQSGAVALRELLSLYADLADPMVAKHAESIIAMASKAVTRRLPVSGPLVFGRGIGIEATIDEMHFAGSSPYLFGSVLEQFLSRHVSMNVFCQMSLHSANRGLIATWPPRWGGRPDA